MIMDLEKLTEKERYDVLTDIADQYYNKGKTQSEIADLYETNRFKIARLLQDARAEQIVEIRINYSNERNIQLEKELKEQFALQKALVVNTQYSPYLDSLYQIGKIGADYLKKILTPGSCLGITWGKTIYSIISQLSGNTHNPVAAVQMTGCLKLPNPAAESRELVRMVAAAYYGTCHYIDAPLYVRSAEFKQELMDEPVIQNTLKKAESMTAVITGIGSLSSLPVSQPVFAPYVSASDLERMNDYLGSIYGYILDNRGRITDIEMNRKVVAAPIETILNIPHRFAVVYGRHKAEVTYHALRNRLVNEILTDTDTALNLLELTGNHKKAPNPV